MGIDLLDIVYNLEKTFSIKIDRGDLIPDDILYDKQSKYVVHGKLTALGLQEIKERMPSADFSTLEKAQNIQSFATVLTVKCLYDLVEQKIRKTNEESNKSPYSRMEIEQGVREILCKVLAVKPEEIKPEARIYTDLGAE
jgi:acyl carrier protein